MLASMALTSMLFGWPVDCWPVPRCYPARRDIFRVSDARQLAALAAVGSLIMGFGMAFSVLAPWYCRSSASASNSFSRNVGSTLGATVLGAVLNHYLTRATGSAPGNSE